MNLTEIFIYSVCNCEFKHILCDLEFGRENSPIFTEKSLNFYNEKVLACLLAAAVFTTYLETNVIALLCSHGLREIKLDQSNRRK